MENKAGRIIVVDDNPVYRSAMMDILSQSDYAAYQKGSPQEFLAEIKSISVDQLKAVVATMIILVDLRMTRMTGIQFIQQLLDYFAEIEIDPPSIVGMTAGETHDFALRLSQIGQEVGEHSPVKAIIGKAEVELLLATIANILSTNNSVNESTWFIGKLVHWA